MPKREDENWVRWQEDKEGIRRKPLCPFCAKSDRLYYKLYIRKGENAWRCAWCNKSFPLPSGGKITKEQIKHMVREHYSFLDKYKQIREYYPKESYQQTQQVRDSVSKMVPANTSRGRPLKDEFVEHRERMQSIQRPIRSRPRTSRRPFSLNGLLILFLIAVGIGVIVYTIFLLLDHRVNTGIAIAVIAAGIISVIWNASRGRRHR